MPSDERPLGKLRPPPTRSELQPLYSQPATSLALPTAALGCGALPTAVADVAAAEGLEDEDEMGVAEGPSVTTPRLPLAKRYSSMAVG